MNEAVGDRPAPAVPCVAAIDIGTNSIKLIVATLDNRAAQRVYERVVVTRLGEGMQAQTPRLREAPIRRTLDALAEMVDAAHSHGAQKIAAVGTAALRSADNRADFLRRAEERSHVKIEVIGGDEEARLSFMAVRRDPEWRNCHHLLVIDVGGGSTEVVQGELFSDKIATRTSIELGAVRLTESCLKSDPPTITQLAAAHQTATAGFQGVNLRPAGEPFTVVGVGGTATSLAAMDIGAGECPDLIHGHILTCDRLEQRIEQLSRFTVAQRERIAGLDPRRADIILGGAIVLLHALAIVSCNRIAISTRGLRWGLLYDRFDR